MADKSLLMSTARRFLSSAVFGLIPFFALAQSSAEPVSIGRSSLTLPDSENWTVQDSDPASIGLSGDVNLPLVMGSKRLTYFSTDKQVKAVFISKVTKGGVAGVTLTWTNRCPTIKESSNVFKIDKGTPNDIDCLVVIRVNQIDSFVNARAPLKSALGDVQPNTKNGFYIQYAKSMGAGGYTFSEALVANDLKGIEGEIAKNESAISPLVLGWAVAFAKSNAAAVDSLSGKWSIPALVFNPK